MKTKGTRLLSLLLVALGFSSCDSTESPVEYGTPSASFKVVGKVIDSKTGAPVENLRAGLVELRIEGRDTLERGGLQWVATDKTGQFALKEITFPLDTVRFRLKLEDNSGLYREKVQTVVFIRPKYTDGRGPWYRGETAREVEDIAVDPVEKEE